MCCVCVGVWPFFVLSLSAVKPGEQRRRRYLSFFSVCWSMVCGNDVDAIGFCTANENVHKSLAFLRWQMTSHESIGRVSRWKEFDKCNGHSVIDTTTTTTTTSCVCWCVCVYCWKLGILPLLPCSGSRAEGHPLFSGTEYLPNPPPPSTSSYDLIYAVEQHKSGPYARRRPLVQLAPFLTPVSKTSPW